MALLIGTLVINLLGIYLLYRVSTTVPFRDTYPVTYVDDRQYPTEHKSLVGYQRAGWTDHMGRIAYINDRNEVFYENPVIENWLS
jgi:hypothetical protein